MNFFHKNRLVFWVLIVLVVINLSALISFFFFTRAETPVQCCSPEEQQCTAFRDELNLTAEQTRQVGVINKKYQESAAPIALNIKEIRASILTELEKERPDTAQLDKFTNQLAELQLKIQKENIKQYTELKRVCTQEQAHWLSALYRDLYGCPMQDGQMQHRYRQGHGNDKTMPCK